MIVKNESQVIRRCLNSVLPFIDCWSVVDTGSTDGTHELVRDTLKHLPGQLHERPWKDFGHNRTEALELARPWGDYSLVIDADETLEAPAGFQRPKLEAEAYYTRHRSSTSVVSFLRLQFFKTTAPWRYEGILHEVAIGGGKHRLGRVEELLCVGHFDSARNQVDAKEKYGRDARVLEEALKREPDNARYRYYLARSYRDAGEPQKALENFLRRADMGGWEEEVWHSLHIVGEISAQLGKYHAAVAAQLQAYQFRPTRAETLCSLAQLHRIRKEHHLSYLFAQQAVCIPRPDDLLFVDDSVYEWRALDEFGIAAYWVGEYQKSLDAAIKLLNGAALPADQRERVEQNRRFAESKLEAKRAGDSTEAPQT
ncbi:MAG: tetratricopeptide repeat protein [Myxococcales bacterium]